MYCIWNYVSAVNYNTAYSEAAHKYLLKAFYNRINKKKYDLQIWQHNILYTNIIAIKDVITVAERSRENKELLTMENTDKTAMAEVAKVSDAIDLGSKDSWATSNADMDATGNLRLTSI